MKYLLTHLIVLLGFLYQVYGNQNFVRVLTQTPSKLELEFSFPDVQTETGYWEGMQVSTVRIPGLNLNYEENQPLLPVFSTTFIAPPGKIRWEVVIQEKKDIHNVVPLLYSNPTEDGANSTPTIWKGKVFPQQNVVVEDLGIFRDYRLMGVKIYPVQAVNGGLVFYQKFKLVVYFPNQYHQSSGNHSVSIDEQKLFQEVAVNGNQIGQIPAAVFPANNSAAIPNSGFQNSLNRIRIVVKKRGIYHITGQDLLDAQINIQEINPQTFRLSNKGKDVPLLIHGEEDSRFDANDYIEFWGEPNEKTMIDRYPDIYKDPFSDENVYWLEWGGSPGIRMVEESGAVTETDPTKYNPALFYPYTVHLEKDTHFERLGYGNIHRLSYTRDLWFFDSGIQSIGKKTYPLELIYPDSNSFSPVYVKVKLCGKSQNQHNVMVWLNHRLVGRSSSYWTHQDTTTISNYNSSTIRSSDLKHGTNELDILLPTLSGPDHDETDYVLFNWAEVTYDRQYKAYQNYIEFGKPSPSVIYFPQIKLFQFEITNFTRSDVEIYKKGISKIVNFQIIPEVGSNNQVLYKIVFQDQVLSDDIEYIALTPDKKLKPVRIEADEPFDPDNPGLSLKDPSNSADYLIITHHNFYQRAKVLADYRRQQGLHVLMVNVQDIYDEFNYGIKSPLAIQNFLKYAFYHWDRTHRLKYVLLLGDANYNYKLVNVPNADYVPTFFFQSYKFGAVATDFPYSLVSGDDYIPDLFIGRIPASTNGEITGVIQKIQEYEQTSSVDAWRNTAVFVSGNDLHTYEFNPTILTQFGLKLQPAFRTQNQRLIDMLLPRHYSAYKLNTVKNDTVTYDPNFGGTTDLIEYFDNGCSFMTFLGHGGGAIWADVQLLNLQDVDRLNNKGKYPFIASMTCFTGAFDNPGNPGLAQKLLLSTDKGAIAVLGSSGLGWVANDYSILWNVMKHLFVKDLPLSAAVTMGKIDYFISSQYVINDTIVPGQFWGHGSIRYDMVHQYNLIGDPYVRLKVPEKELSVRVDNNLINPGDTIRVTVTSQLSGAEGYLELANGKDDIVYHEPIFMAGSQNNFAIPVPGDFPDGPGYVRAYLSDGFQDEVGVAPVACNYAVFDSFSTVPSVPNAEDSVSITLVAKHQLGIEEVKIVALIPNRFGGLDSVRIKAMPIGDDRFRTIKKIPPTYALDIVHVIAYAVDSQGHLSRMNFNYEVHDTRPDPFIYEGKIRLVGEERVKLGVSVGNTGIFKAENFDVAVYEGEIAFQNQQPFASKKISLDGKDSTTVVFDFPFPLNVNSYKIYAQVNPGNTIPDFNPGNNLDSSIVRVNMYNVSPELGSSYDNQQNDTLALENSVKFWVAPQSVTQPTAVQLNLASIPKEWEQEELTPVILYGDQDARMVHINIFNPDAVFNVPYYLLLKFDKANFSTHPEDLAKLRLYHWEERMKAWVFHESWLTPDSSAVYASLRQSGYWALFVSNDSRAPKIELTVDGRPLRSKAQVSTEPTMNLVIEDESGLFIQKNQIKVLIDNQPLPEDKIFIPDSVQQSKILGISAYPKLELGEHIMHVEVRDVNGNTSQKDFTLVVSDEFDVHVFGNYPNPFSDFTIFTYFVSPDVLDEFEIRIYTVSGRLIRRIENDVNTINQPFGARASGYNELMWDGKDEDGNEVANGVYFALLRAKYKGEVKETILKVAKLK